MLVGRTIPHGVKFYMNQPPCIIPCQIDKNMLSTHSNNVFKNKNCGKGLIISVYDVHASVTKVTRAYERHDPKFGKPASVRSVYTY